jgi:hypothetical protein
MEIPLLNEIQVGVEVASGEFGAISPVNGK